MAQTNPPGESKTPQNVVLPTESEIEGIAEVAGKKRRQRIIVLSVIAALGGGLYGYDTGVFSGALLAMDVRNSGFVLNAWDKGLITSILLVGAAIGSFYGGRLADVMGRRKVMRISALFFTIGALACAFAPTLPVLLIARVILGVGLGASSTIVPLYIGEMAPVEGRGRLVSINTAMINVAQCGAIVVNAFIGIHQPYDWRIMLGMAAIPAIIFGFGIFFIQETPNYWAHHGDNKKALEVLLMTRSSEEARQELYLINENIEAERSSKDIGKLRYFIQTPWLRRTLIAGLGAAMINQFTGVNVMMYFAPTLLSQLGFNPSNALLATVPIGLVGLIAATIGGLGFTDRFDRKPFLMIGLSCVVVCHICIGITYLFMDPNHPSTAFAFLILAFILLFLAAMQGMVSPATWLLMAEVFPAKVRGQGMGIASLSMNVVNFCISLIFLPVMNVIGGTGTFIAFAVINIGSLAFTYFFMPETRGKSLEQIEMEARQRAAR